jgi:hypothetical protein
MNAAAADFDEEQHVQPLQPDRIDAEESTAITLFAWARRNSRHDRRHDDSETSQLANDTLMAPPRILACEPHDQHANVRADRRSTRRSRISPALRHQATLATQERRWRHEKQRPADAWGFVLIIGLAAIGHGRERGRSSRLTLGNGAGRSGFTSRL